MDTHPDLGMDITASSFALGGARPKESADVVERNPGGSSVGSAIAVSAGLSPFALGTETEGSLIVPDNRTALCTMKVTIGIVTQQGIVPDPTYVIQQDQ
ncbi:MAG: hypothetical protein Q9170_005492 [Blastenia crenularia]